MKHETVTTLAIVYLNNNRHSYKELFETCNLGDNYWQWRNLLNHALDEGGVNSNYLDLKAISDFLGSENQTTNLFIPNETITIEQARKGCGYIRPVTIEYEDANIVITYDATMGIMYVVSQNDMVTNIDGHRYFESSLYLNYVKFSMAQ